MFCHQALTRHLSLWCVRCQTEQEDVFSCHTISLLFHLSVNVRSISSYQHPRENHNLLHTLPAEKKHFKVPSDDIIWHVGLGWLNSRTNKQAKRYNKLTNNSFPQPPPTKGIIYQQRSIVRSPDIQRQLRGSMVWIFH